ncbi:MAG: T9SS type A sorting domain-containing protein, partial [Ignavibacteriaceae bacterium]|nr:T9SS type A sorting domain-containing protein [Ignavibacteriaceae bacterium]
MYTGLYENSSTGAKIYKRTFVVSVEELDSEIPVDYKLEQNFPNPFNPTTTIQFSIPELSFVKIEVFNTLGEKVTTLVSEELFAGNYRYEWDATNLTSGVYLYKMQTTNFSTSKIMIFLK